MVGERTGNVRSLFRCELGTDFHLKVRPQSNPPRTRGEALYWSEMRGRLWHRQGLGYLECAIADDVNDRSYDVHGVLRHPREQRLRPPNIGLHVGIKKGEDLGVCEAGGQGKTTRRTCPLAMSAPKVRARMSPSRLSSRL